MTTAAAVARTAEATTTTATRTGTATANNRYRYNDRDYNRTTLNLNFRFGAPGYSSYGGYGYNEPAYNSWGLYPHECRYDREFGYWYGRPAEVEVRRCADGYGNIYVVQGSQRLWRYR